MNTQVRDTPAVNSLGQRLRRARETARYTRPQLATAAGIPAKSIEKFEADEQEPSVSRLMTLCSVLGASLDEILGTARSQQHDPSPVPMGGPLPDIEADPVGDLLNELDELREDGFDNAQRRAMAIVTHLGEELRFLEPRELVSVARERGVDTATCPSVLDLQNAMTNDPTKGQLACGELEQRIIDTALLGSDLFAVPFEVLSKVADQLRGQFDLQGEFFGGWGDHSKLVPQLREPLRHQAYVGRSIDLAKVESPSRRS